MTYLVSAGYLAGNPLALRRGRNASIKRSRRVERYLDHALWNRVLASVEQWPRLTERDEQHYERSRWLMNDSDLHVGTRTIAAVQLPIPATSSSLVGGPRSPHDSAARRGQTAKTIRNSSDAALRP